MKFKTIIGRSFKKRVQTKDLTIITTPNIELLSSSIYPQYFTEGINTNSTNIDGRISIKGQEGLVVRRYDQDNAISSIKAMSGLLKKVLQTTTMKKDYIKSDFVNLVGILRDLLKLYSFKDNIKHDMTIVTGQLVSKLMLYEVPNGKISVQITKVETIFNSLNTSYESFLYGGSSIQRAARNTYRRLQTTFSQPISEPLPNHSTVNLIFKEPLIELDPNNIKLIFGKKVDEEKEPEVVINEYTTAALDFENELIDKIPTTIWTQEGDTSRLNSINRIFGTTSFETTSLGDSLYTKSNIITGGGIPFTIEFYIVLKENTRDNYFPLFSQTYSTGGGEQLVGVNSYGFLNYNRAYSFGTPILYNSLLKLHRNTIHKIVVTYDRAALRFFVDDKLYLIIGTSNGWINTHNPFRFLRCLEEGFDEYQFTTLGLIDNINIHNGIATKVRDYDPNEENLIVDLAFDGENNSRTIVDNGTLKSTWMVASEAKINNNGLELTGGSWIESPTTISEINSNKKLTIEVQYKLTFDFNGTRALINLLVNANTRLSLYLRSTTNPCVWLNGTQIFDVTVPSLSDLNRIVKFRLVIDGNFYSLFINDILVSSTSVSQILPNNPKIFIGQSGNNNEYFHGNINSVKIYDNLAIIPESPIGKIQLDFDNNVLDEYNNSTWTNNGVTFDQMNSVKGSAAKFNSSAFLQSDYTFNMSDTTIEFDCKHIENTYQRILRSSSNQYFFNKEADGTLTLQGRYTTSQKIIKDCFYNYKLLNKTNLCLLKLNDVIVAQSNNFTEQYYNSFIIGHINSAQSINGYLDNFKVTKDYQDEVSIDKPAVHLPLETNNMNIGFTDLVVNSVGNPTYTSVGGKKCIKFGQGKYLTITINSIFNLGTSSDFYMEFDLYIESFLSSTNYPHLISMGAPIAKTALRFNGSRNIYLITDAGNKILYSPTVFVEKRWYKIKLFRTQNQISLDIDGDVISEISEDKIDFTYSNTTIGGGTFYSGISLDGCISDFKMFVGTSKPPSTYHDKKVLDLDFKPTRKSYLFKDNNNKCIIHPVNVTQRDYQDSQYCCYFNGTDQHLELGKNNSLNFGDDDFVIYFKFKIHDLTDNFNMLISALHKGSLTKRSYFGIGGSSRTDDFKNKLLFDISDDDHNIKIVANTNIIVNKIYEVMLIQRDSYLEIYVDRILDSVPVLVTSPIDFNYDDNTALAKNLVSDSSANAYSNITLYSVKVLRNTTDLSLLELEENGEEEVSNISLTVNTIDRILNPEVGYRIPVVGKVLDPIDNTDEGLIFSLALNDVEIPVEDLITSGTSNIFDFTFNINSDLLPDGVSNVVLEVKDRVGSATKTIVISLLRDILTPVDSFNTSWYQGNPNNLVYPFNIQGRDMMYFDGLSSLYSTNYLWNFGLQPFTIEFDILVSSLKQGYIYSYGKTSSSERWFDIIVTSTGNISFIVKNTTVLTSSLPIVANKITRVSLTRDYKYQLRVFIDGKLSGDVLLARSFIKPIESPISEKNNTMYIGRSATRSDNYTITDFTGYLSNAYVKLGECLYTNDYVVTNYIKRLENKSILNFIDTPTNFVDKVDNFHPDISWKNYGCVVEDNSLVMTDLSNCLVSSSTAIGDFGKSNWTIDIRATTKQISVGSVLFDSRIGEIEGIIIEQPDDDPTSLTVSIGLKGNLGVDFNYRVNTGRATIKVNEEFSLKVTKNQFEVILFLNGLEVKRVNLDLNIVSLNLIMYLGNRRERDKAFIGKIREFRLINGNSTDTYKYKDEKKEGFK